MKVVAINGSPHLIGNTSSAVTVVLDELEKEGVETEHIQIYGSQMTPCNACGSCSIRGDGRCINEDDEMNNYLAKIMEADGLILAAPTYYGTVPGQMKILLERMGLVSATNNNQLARKVGGVISVQGHHGGLFSYLEMVNFLLQNQMTVCGASSCAVLTGNKPSEVLNDRQGVAALKSLGKEMAWLISKVVGE